jgi:hypothetical protein
MIMEQFSASSLQEFIPSAPTAFNDFILFENRLKTTREKPFLIKLVAMDFPVTPNPIKPIFSSSTCFFNPNLQLSYVCFNPPGS